MLLTDLWLEALYNLKSGSWLAWANETAAHYVAGYPLPVPTNKWISSRHTDIPPLKPKKRSPKTLTLMWMRKCSWRPNALPQTVHVWGLTPVWITVCRCRWAKHLNFLSHTLHSYGRLLQQPQQQQVVVVQHTYAAVIYVAGVHVWCRRL